MLGGQWQVQVGRHLKEDDPIPTNGPADIVLISSFPFVFSVYTYSIGYCYPFYFLMTGHE